MEPAEAGDFNWALIQPAAPRDRPARPHDARMAFLKCMLYQFQFKGLRGEHCQLLKTQPNGSNR
jgi:hypothetical protein